MPGPSANGATLRAALAALALALAGAVALEVSRPMPDSGAVIPTRASNSGQASARLASGRPAETGPGRVPAWVATALERPLFSPSRRPPPAGPAAAGPAAPVADRLPRMTGVLVTPTVRRAIFAGPDGTSLVVPEGGRVGSYTVRAVRAGQAVVSGPDGERTVSPVFDPDAAVPAAAAPVPQPGLPGLPGFRLDGGALGGVPGLTGPDRPPPAPPAPAAVAR